LQSGRHGAWGDIKGIKKGISYAQKEIEHVEKDAKHIKLKYFPTFAQTK
jgi:archaellum component FlaC